MEEGDEVLDDSLGEMAAIFCEGLFSRRPLDSKARIAAEVSEACHLEGDPDDDGERADPVELHRDRGGQRPEVRPQAPFVEEHEQRLCEARVPRGRSLGGEAPREEWHVDRLLDFVQIDGSPDVEQPVEDDLAPHPGRATDEGA